MLHGLHVDEELIVARGSDVNGKGMFVEILDSHPRYGDIDGNRMFAILQQFEVGRHARGNDCLDSLWRFSLAVSTGSEVRFVACRFILVGF